MPRAATRADVLAAIAALGDAHPDRTVFVGIDGFGASGKSTLAAAVEAAVGRADVVHVDDFSGPHITEWDWPRFNREVREPLLRGTPARYQVWDWDRHAAGAWVELPKRGVVIVEGVSSTRAEVGLPWDLTIWVEAPREIRLRRAAERDGAAMLSRWLDDWMPSEEAYAAREAPLERVDLVVSGTETVAEPDDAEHVGA